MCAGKPSHVLSCFYWSTRGRATGAPARGGHCERPATTVGRPAAPRHSGCLGVVALGASGRQHRTGATSDDDRDDGTAHGSGHRFAVACTVRVPPRRRRRRRAVFVRGRRGTQRSQQPVPRERRDPRTGTFGPHRSGACRGAERYGAAGAVVDAGVDAHTNAGADARRTRHHGGAALAYAEAATAGRCVNSRIKAFSRSGLTGFLNSTPCSPSSRLRLMTWSRS